MQGNDNNRSEAINNKQLIDTSPFGTTGTHSMCCSETKQQKEVSMIYICFSLRVILV